MSKSLHKNLHTNLHANLHADKHTNCNLEYQDSADKILHPTNIIQELFSKTFQILDVLCKSELPDLI